MAASQKPKKKKKHGGLWFLEVFSVLLILLSFWFLFLFIQEWEDYRVAKESYENLKNMIVEVKNEEEAGISRISRIDFAALQQINGEAQGWLEIPALDVSLPVVWGRDNVFYLDHAFDGSHSPAGCLFFSAEEYDQKMQLHQVIYGHNMKDNSMFGRLDDYQNQSFYEANPFFYLYTPNGDYRARIFSAHFTLDGNEVYNVSVDDTDYYKEMLGWFQACSLYDTGVDIMGREDNATITLSTCTSSYVSKLARFVVHAFLEPISAEEVASSSGETISEEAPEHAAPIQVQPDAAPPAA